MRVHRPLLIITAHPGGLLKPLVFLPQVPNRLPILPLTPHHLGLMATETPAAASKAGIHAEAATKTVVSA